MNICNKLQSALTHNGNGDIDANELCGELRIVGRILEGCNIEHTIDILKNIADKKFGKFITKRNDCIQNSSHDSD